MLCARFLQPSLVIAKMQIESEDASQVGDFIIALLIQMNQQFRRNGKRAIHDVCNGGMC